MISLSYFHHIRRERELQVFTCQKKKKEIASSKKDREQLRTRLVEASKQGDVAQIEVAMLQLVSAYQKEIEVKIGGFCESMPVKCKTTLKFSSVVSKAVLPKYNQPSLKIGGKFLYLFNQL